MKLSRRSLLVRWAYLFESVPARTSLCAIFWRTVLFTPLKLIWFGGALLAVGGVAWWYWRLLAVAAAAIGAGIVVAKMIAALPLRPTAGTSKDPSPFVLAARSVKSRVCPLVELE